MSEEKRPHIHAESNWIYPIQFVQVGDLDNVPAPLVRISTCGGITIEVLQEVLTTDPPQGRYAAVTPQQRRQGSTTGRNLLNVLVSLPRHYAAKGWLTEKLYHNKNEDDEVAWGGMARVDNIVTLLRGLLCPPGIEGEKALRKALVTYIPNRFESGPGYQLATEPLLWLDVDAIECFVKQACLLEQGGKNALPLWEQAYTLASKGSYLPDELYSDWASDKRSEVDGYLRQTVHALYRLYLARDEEADEEQALLLLRTYWQIHPTDEDVFRPLLELLGKRGCIQEADEYYHHLCQKLDLEGRDPNQRTQNTIQNVYAEQHQQSRNSTQIREYPSLLSTPSHITQRKETADLFPLALMPNFWGKEDHLSIVLSNPVKQSTSAYTHLVSFSEKFPESPFLELQQKLTQEVTTLNISDKNNEGCLLSRREALLAIAVLAMPMFAPSQKRLASLDIEETLSSLATSIHACWQLSNDFDICAVHSALSTYTPLLISITRQSPSHRKVAAHLTAQVFLLSAIIGRHVANLQAAEDSCKEAIMYSEIAEDPILHIATLRHLAMIYYYAKRHKQELALYQQMMPLLSLGTISPMVQSFVHAGRAGTQALSGSSHEARVSLALARETFSQQPNAEACPLYIDYDYSQLFISEGLTYYDLGCYEEALESFLQVDGLSPKIPVAERGRLEFLNCQALSILRLPHRDREMQQCINYWKAGIQGAMALKSRQRYDEACRIYELMTFVWPYEKKIIELREIIE
jgi:tetratricopeptide (TPR) repeat protein